MKELAAAYARLPGVVSPEQMEHDVRRIIRENVGRDIDRRLVRFYLHEIAELVEQMKARRNTRGEILPTSYGSVSLKD